MTDVGSADLSRLLQSKRNECSSIVTSRKRKLRELFAVTTHVESLPHEVLANPDAPTSTPAEWQFLQANDIIQGKIFNERNIPPRPKLSLDILKKSLANSVFVAPESLPPAPQEQERKHEVKDEKVVNQDEGQTKGPGPATQPSVAGAVATNATVNNSMNAISTRTATPNTLVPSPNLTSLNGPNATSTPTATPSTLGTSPRPDLAPQTPSTEGVEPVVPPKSVTAISQPTAPATEAQDAGVGTPRKQVQVTFSAGTKGSPSEDATKENDGVPAEVSLGQKPGESDGLDNDAKSSQTEPVNDNTRVPDAASSPESTAQSATTPAPQDISTDTSPDNEGNMLYDRDREKREESGDAEEEVDEQSTKPSVLKTAEDLQKHVLEAPPDSAEAQLLQESIQSNDVAESSAVQASTSAGESGVDHVGGQTSEPIDIHKSLTRQEVSEQLNEEDKEDEVAAPTEPTNGSQETKEIPDSQEEAPDQMDVDGPESNTNAQPSSATFPEDTNSTSQEIPTTPQAGPRESSSQAPERAVTRVSSGAMRLKSVSEIVGESPRPTPTIERAAPKRSVEEQLTPRTSTPKSPGLRQRHMSAHRRERSKGQISTVVFGKKPKQVDDKSLTSGHREALQPTDDYYTPLFVQGFAGSSSWMQPLEKILFTANKTVATPDANLAIQDHQACKVLRRVYHLQQHDKWSLRQPKRCPEPVRPPSHWDVLLKEMKWMRTDFREERKWKMSVARTLAYACAEWHEATPEDRKLLQVPAVIPPKVEPTTDVSMADIEGDGPDNQPTPDLISSADLDSLGNVDELAEEFVETVAPSAIFSLQDDEVIFGLRRTAAADKLLEELPMFGGPLKVPRFDLTGPEYDPDAHWRRPALPLSKYVEGHMKLVCDGPPRKRSRYNYQNEDSEDEEAVFADDQASHSIKIPPQTAEVALFNPEMKHIRDRLHAGHQFRPPSEHPMPTQNFYECRNASQWTLAEDDELRLLVKDYAYNWSLISSLLSTKSLFMSGAERRTPWECFERWINLEGLPADMQKTQYFKAYNSRIEAAQRIIMQQNQIAAQQASQAGGAVTPVRRRPSTPLRVERRRNQKHLAIIDAMRKLAKKRETTIQKQQHSASQNANNKKNNDPVTRGPTKTPRDYSLLRWERDQALAEKMAQYAQRQEAQRRATLQARAQQGQAGQMGGNPAQPQPGQNAGHPNPAAAAAAAVAAANGMNGVGRVPNPMAAAAAVAAAAAGQGRPRMPMPAPANGMTGMPSHMASGLVPPAQMNSVQHAQLQAAMQGQQHRMPMPNPQENASLMMQAQRISQQQRQQQLQQVQQLQQQQQQQQQGGPGTPNPAAANQGSPPPNMRNGVNGVNGVSAANGLNGMSQQNFMQSAQAMLASFNAANNASHSTPPANGLHMPSGPAGSPGARPPISANLMSQLNVIEASYRAKNPNLTPEQLRQMATEHITRVVLAQRQSAINAAAGGNGNPGIANSIAATTSPHQYAALLRQQQQQQANQAAGNSAHQRQSSGSATPGPGK